VALLVSAADRCARTAGRLSPGLVSSELERERDSSVAAWSSRQSCAAPRRSGVEDGDGGAESVEERTGEREDTAVSAPRSDASKTERMFVGRRVTATDDAAI
jgi:hypothetical protein